MSGVTILDRKPHQKGAARWANMSSKAMLDRNGAVLRDEAGKIKYVSILQWTDRNTAHRFRDAVVAELLARHPDAFEEGG